MKVRKTLIWTGIIISILIVLGIIKNVVILEKETSSFSSGDYKFTLNHDGLERIYLVHVPLGYEKNKSYPAVLALHGGGGNAEGAPKYFGLNKKSDQEKFIVVYPEGSGKKVLGKTFATWNTGKCCGDAFKNNVDDVGFINNLLKDLGTKFNIDKKRIYITGMSNGAQMTYRLACELSDKIAAIAPSGSQGTLDVCNPKNPVPVFHMQGKVDPCSLYEGGMCGKCVAEFWDEFGLPTQHDDWECISIPDYVENWSIQNGCSNETNVTFQNKGATCVTYENCPKDAGVTLCTVAGLGHNWPGQTSYVIQACDDNQEGKICQAWMKNVGPLSQDLIANDHMWDFFKKHPMN